MPIEYLLNVNLYLFDIRIYCHLTILFFINLANIYFL